MIIETTHLYTKEFEYDNFRYFELHEADCNAAKILKNLRSLRTCNCKTSSSWRRQVEKRSSVVLKNLYYHGMKV